MYIPLLVQNTNQTLIKNRVVGNADSFSENSEIC